MIIYLSIGNGKKIKEFVKAHHLGWCISPSCMMNPGAQKYFLDNGAFLAAKKNEPFNETAFKVLVNKFKNPDFIVLPDIAQIKHVFDGDKRRKLAMASLRRSISYFDLIPRPVYLAVQDGMIQSDIIPYIDHVDGLFVGGSPGWKLKTAFDWTNLAHLHKKKCHVGRINQFESLAAMDYFGVDSVDGSTASRHDDPTEIKKYFSYLKEQKRLDV